MRRILIVVALLALAVPVEAGPINWAKQQFRDHPLRTQLVFAGISAGVYAEGLHKCRIVNVENCDAHYGSAWGSYGATIGLNLVGVLVGHKLGGKLGNAIAYGGSGAVLGWGIYQWRGGLNKPREDRDREPKPDLSSVAFVHR